LSGNNEGGFDDGKQRTRIERLYGNIHGLGASQLRRIEHLYRRRVPPENILTHELARNLTEISAEINRQIGLLLTRRGEVALVVVGSDRQIVLPPLDRFRSSSARFKGLRLLHTHLNGEDLTDDDLTDLALLRLDLVCAVEVLPDGLPGLAYTAHLLPENQDGRYWEILPPQRPSEMETDFLSFIQGLESEFAKKQQMRKIDAIDKAILIRVETDPRSDAEGSIAELKELARSCGVEVFGSLIQHRHATDPKYVLGKGKLSDLVIGALQKGANLLIFDHELSAAQIRSITEFTEMKVIDRTQLILDIFAQRAMSREGKIQVELAQLRYLLPRLTGKGTAMSRLAGGIGGRGPGETKLEIDRRRVRERIHRLEKLLKEIGKGRDRRRTRRERTGIPVISIVGYTNAGKSTLLNALTRSRVLTEDKLFATLDPKSARLRFPREREALVTDTVGFIRNLPPELFSAFRATLDELQDAHILLHVIDAGSPDFEERIRAVEHILEELGVAEKPQIRVLNKEDLIADKGHLAALCRRFDAVAVSALNIQTLHPLLARMEAAVGRLGGPNPYGNGDLP